MEVDSAPTTTSTTCSSANGCSEISLTASSSADLFNMLGSALPLSHEMSTIRLVSDAANAQCADGCPQSVAADIGLVGQSVWHYDSALGTYSDLSATGTLNPWESVWVVAKSGLAGTTNNYLFPALPPEVNPPSDLLANVDSAGNLDTRDTSINLPAFPAPDSCLLEDAEVRCTA